MKLRLVNDKGEPSVAVLFRDRWISLHEALKNLKSDQHSNFKNLSLLQRCRRDVLVFLQHYDQIKQDVLTLFSLTEDAQLHDFVDSKSLLPFEPKSLRDSSLWEKHLVDSARQLIKQSKPFVYPIIRAFEILTCSTFPAFKPKKIWKEKPIYYMGNHLNVYTNGDTIPYPSYTNALDYELEIGIIISKKIRNANLETAGDAIGGFVLFNDFSARDIQLDEMIDGKLGPTKTKSFANSIGHIVVTKDEVIDQFDSLEGQVYLNGKMVAKGNTKGAHHSIEELVAYASMSETLYPGEIIGTGTLPGCAGIEKSLFLKEGDTVELRMEPFGKLLNIIGKKETPNEFKSKKKKKFQIGWCNAFLVLILSLLAYLIWSPSPIQPIKYYPPKSYELTDLSVPIYYIHKSEKYHFKGSIFGPESIATDKNGNLFASLSDGTIRKIDFENSKEEIFVRMNDEIPLSHCNSTKMEHICGRPLGLRFDKYGNLLVADAYFGLFNVTPDGKKMKLADSINGIKFIFSNDLIQAKNGKIYFTDTSTKYYRRDHMKDILEARENGRVLEYDPITKQVSIIADKLAFPNGVVLTNDEKELLVVETTKSRIIKISLYEKNYPKKVLIDNLPCIPDNIRENGKGIIWLGCHCPRSKPIDFIHKYPILKEILIKIDELLGKRLLANFKKKGPMIIGLDEKGNIVHVLYDPKSKHLGIISEVHEHENYLYIGSIVEKYIARVEIPNYIKNY